MIQTNYLSDEKQTQKYATQFAQICEAPLVIGLQGEIGTGKTTFCRAMIQACGVTEPIKSPTYTLVETYETSRFLIHHFDLYRIHEPNELVHLGISDYFSHAAICLVEWPMHGEGFLPVCDLLLTFSVKTPGRTMHCVAKTARGKQYLLRWMDILTV